MHAVKRCVWIVLVACLIGITSVASAQEDNLKKLDAIVAKAQGGTALPEVLKEIDALVAAAPDFAPAHLVRGQVLSALKRPDEALAAYESALKLDPKMVDALYNSGVLLADMGRKEDAAARFDQAAAADPATAIDPLYNAGQAYYDLKRYADALDRWQRALAMAPNDFDITKKIIQCQFGLGKLDDAKKTREALINIRKTSTDPRIQKLKDYVFDQFAVGSGWVYAREVFDQTGDLYYVYIFEYTENNKPVRTVNLESSAVIREQGIPYIIGLDEGGKHTSTGFTFKEIPDYPALKAQAIDILTKRAAGQQIEGATSAPTP